MSDHIKNSSVDSFLLIDDAARSLNLDAKVLRQGIACGLVPIRKDNIGIVRVHLGEVPADLQERIHLDDIQPELHVTALTDEILNHEKNQAESEVQRIRLEQLVIKQGSAITRYLQLLDSTESNLEGVTSHATANGSFSTDSENLAQRDAEVIKLKSILDRTFQAMKARDEQVAVETGQLTRTADKAIDLLERAVRDGELSTEQLHMLNQQVSSTAHASVRLESELDERNSVISNQNTLMERLVAVAEQSVTGASAGKRRKRSFWQRLFGGGKGI